MNLHKDWGVTDDIEPARLAKFLRVLANPVRLEIMRLLNRPKALHEIRVSPNRAEDGKQPTRAMSRVAVSKHLLQLVGVGVVQSRRLLRQGRTLTQYQLSRPQVFALSEEFLSMVRLGGGDGLMDGTLPGPPGELRGQPTGPHLVLVRGMDEGRCYHLEPQQGRVWNIGRHHATDLCLDYDGYLSQLNSRIEYNNGGFYVEDVAGNRNGTSVNWDRLPSGARRALLPGDVVGVGRSLLVFRSP